ncbi:MAG: hypothetical protein AMXMBFR61_23720 [Fimbriimonadales bacterium]
MAHSARQPIAPGKHLMLGDEAIAKAAWTRGLNVFAAYAGTPSTEIGETIGTLPGLYGEWSTNEAVSAGVAQGAAYVGGAAMIAFKHVGANVAADYINNFARTRLLEGGALVVVVADDPGMHSSQNAQDTRFLFAYMADMPILSPADSQDCWEMTRAALEMSRELCYPFTVWITTRIAHSMTLVEVPADEAVRDEHLIMQFVPQPHYKSVPANAMPSNRRVVTEFLPRLAQMSDASPFNRPSMRSRRLGVISTGVATRYAQEVFPDASHLQVGFLYPVPKETIRRFASEVEEVIVLEEGARFLEREVRLLGVNCRGKQDPWCGEELEPAAVRRYFTGLDLHPREPLDIPRRPPVMCPGCPHNATYEVLALLDKERKRKRLPKVNRAGDIGCYSLGEMGTLTCMGASITHMHGMVCGLEQKWYSVPMADVSAHITGPLAEQDLVRWEGGELRLKGVVTRPKYKSDWRELLKSLPPWARKPARELYAKANDEIGANWALIGDSTLFHSGSPGILNITHNGGRGNILVFNNSYTAMTGGQDHPGTTKTMRGENVSALNIAKYVVGLGVKKTNVKVVDPFDLKGTLETFKKEMAKPELSVLITNRVCNRERDLFRPGETYTIDRERCMACGICLDLNCPAIAMADGKPAIRPDLCTGCSVCAQICPEKFSAIHHGKDYTSHVSDSLAPMAKLVAPLTHEHRPVTNILIAGVGGQGVLTASAIISELGLKHLGYAAKADVHGMSQLGGEVNSHVRIGRTPILSPVIPAGEVDIILGLEPMEAARYAHMLRPDGVVLACTHKVPSAMMARGKTAYPDDVLDRLVDMGISVIALDAWAVSLTLGDPRVVNSYMLGALSQLLPFAPDVWREVISERLRKGAGTNLAAFDMGRNAVHLPPEFEPFGPAPATVGG